MARLLGVMVLVVGGAFAVPSSAEDMASPGHPGWQAAEGSGCLVWNEAQQAGEKLTWSGPCKGNRASGQGELIRSYSGKTARYVGEMRDGKPNGRGTITWASGLRVEGEWIDGELNGRGTLTFANGDRYEGDFVDSKRTGRGTYVYKNGDRYEGDWVDNKRTGHGTYASKNGDRGEGDFVDDIFKKGRVTKTWANGDHYEGDWVDGKQTGSGKMTKANGDWYDGEWSGGFADGEGEAKISGKEYKGVWARGCLRSMEQRAAWDVPRHQCP